MKKNSDLADLTKIVLKFRDERDWRQFHNPKDLALSLMLEAAELLEHFQWKRPEEIEEYMRSHKEAVGEEIVDILYHILLLCHDNNINIPVAFRKKMKKNRLKYPIEKAKGSRKKYTEF